MAVPDPPGSTEPNPFDAPADAYPGHSINPPKEANALEPETIGIITAVTVYIARVVRSEMVR